MSVNRSFDNILTDALLSCFSSIVSLRYILVFLNFYFCFMSQKYYLPHLMLLNFYWWETQWNLVSWNAPETLFLEMPWKKSFTVYSCLKVNKTLLWTYEKWYCYQYKSYLYHHAYFLIFGGIPEYFPFILEK